MRDSEFDFLEIANLITSSKDSKSLLLDALVMAREYYSEDNPEAKGEREERCLAKEIAETITLTLQQNRMEEIEGGKFFYELHPDTTVLGGNLAGIYF